MRGAYRNALESETQKFGIQIFVLRMIDLVHDENDGPLRAAQKSRQFLVNWCQTLLRIDHEKNKVCFAHRRVGGGPDFLQQFCFAAPSDSAGVPNNEVAALARRRNPIPRYAGLIVHNRDVASREPIEERGFPNVRPPNDRYLTAARRFHA